MLLSTIFKIVEKNKPTITEIEKFWDDNPLFTGEVEFNKDSPQTFFKAHDAAYFNDVFAGMLKGSITKG